MSKKKKLSPRIFRSIFLIITLPTVLIVFIIKQKKNKKTQEQEPVDSLTDVGNEKHHIYAFESQISERREKAILRSQIVDGINNGEFKIYMQFISEGESGSICGAEVLSRWENPQYGLLRPYKYVELLKETGKIVDHDFLIFENVCRQLEHWSSEPYDKLFLTCNFTRISVSMAEFSDRIQEISERYQFSHDRLVIEITEDSLALNSETVSVNIRRCSALGFKIAIDDMGAGFSALADIYENEIDVVKIERNFLVSCNTKRRLRMLQDIILLCHNGGAKVICEGIENMDQENMLHGIGCDMMQGFYHSRVLPLSECERFLSGKTLFDKKILNS